VNDDFRDLLRALVASKARFLVVGAHALAFHGVVRATLALDVWVEPTPENAKRVWAALAEFGAPLHALRVDAGDFTRPNALVQFGSPPNRIDILTTISGLKFDAAWNDRVESEVDGVVIPFLGREHLIANKRAAGRKKDLVDAEALETRKL
jgi:hypothetical protein